MARFEKHIFICDNQREAGHPRGCCHDKGSTEIIEEFKKHLKELGLNSKMRVNKAGCLDACEFGPVMVVYPEQIWYGNFSKNDIEEIIQSHLLNDKPVERILIKDKRFL
jgi:(2Fe-2S) ferredoxin